jgi:prolyl-tRNA synthetase
MADNETDAKITVKKDDDFSEWFTQLMKKAELADIRYNIKGFPVYMPWAVKSIRKITRMWEAELESNGHEPLIMPLLIPESNFHREADHVKGFTPEVFWVTQAGDDKFEERLALRPTSETALYDMYGKWIQSYNDLPFKRYQSCSVYRYETKMTRPFLRTRELHWSEAHDVFATEEDAYAQVKEDMETTHKLIYTKLAMPHIFFKRPQWDKFAGAVNTYAADVLLPSGKVLQLPSTHMLGQGFAKAFDVKFLDKDEQTKFGWITCYGPCHSRNYGALITFHGDDKGLVLPWDVVPVEIVVVPIFIKDKIDVVLAKCNALITDLKSEGFTVIFDDKKETSPGFKYNHWEMKGVPIRIEVGPKDVEKGSVAIYRRDLGAKEFIKDADVLSHLVNIKNTFTENLRNKATEKIKSLTVDAKTVDEIREAINKNMIVRTSFCSTELDGETCAKVIEKDIGAYVRGEWFNKNEEVFCDCPICGKKAKHVVYIAKAH